MRVQSRKSLKGKYSQISIRYLQRIPKKQTNSGRGGLSGRCVQQSAIQTAGGTPCTIWRQFGSHKMARSSTSLKKGRHATWKLDLHAHITGSGISTTLSSVLSPLQYLHKGTGGSEQQWLNPAWCLHLRKTGSSTKQTFPPTQQSPLIMGQPAILSQWCQETTFKVNPSKAQALWCTLNNKAAGQAIPAVSLNGEVMERTSSLRYLGIYFDRMLTYETPVESTQLGCKKGLSALKAMAAKGIEQRHLFLLYQSQECDTQRQ